MAIVYRVKNTTNGKLYIGYTSRTLSYRKNGHTQALNKGVDTKFYRAVRKYGKSAFKWKVLATGEPKEMLKLERKLIKEYDCIKSGYNTVRGGEQGNLGYRWNSKQKKRAAKAQKERFSDKYERQRIAKATKKWIKENPDAHAAVVEKRNAVLRTTEYRKSAAAKQREYAENNTDKMKQRGERHSRFYADNPDLAVMVSRKLGGRPIEVFSYDTKKFIKRFSTQHEAARNLSVGVGNVHAVLSGKRNHTGGYVFKYA